MGKYRKDFPICYIGQNGFSSAYYNKYKGQRQQEQ